MDARRIVNCHVHTFTHEHTPTRFVGWYARVLVVFGPTRRLLVWLAHRLDPNRQGPLARYLEIVATSYKRAQADVFAIVRGFYPDGSRFVVLPMDMTFMNAGPVPTPIATQHWQLAELRDRHPDLIIPFAAVDPRHDNIVETTLNLLENEGFRGIKLYPPTGYHPWDERIRPLYSYAEQHNLPVLSHCSRPASVQYRGAPTEQMRRDPNGGAPLPADRYQLLTVFTDPDAYLPILRAYPRLRVCLAHFGGAGDWHGYLQHPWDAQRDSAEKSWLAKILDLLRSGDYPNLWTDISYTLFTDDTYSYLLKVLLADASVRSRVLFGSDFYVVESANQEERNRAIRIRAILGEDLFTTIAVANPTVFLNGPSAADAGLDQVSVSA